MNMILAERICHARKRAGLTQADLAERLKIALPTLNKYEKGHRIPDAELLSRMADILNCDPGWLLSGVEIVAEEPVNYGLDSVSQRIMTGLTGLDEKSREDVLKFIEGQLLWLKSKQLQGTSTEALDVILEKTRDSTSKLLHSLGQKDSNDKKRAQ